VAVAKSNIALAVRYLRCKLYSTALIEALASESGGDGPLEFFMGGIPEPSGPPVVRIEHFLPPPEPPQAGDPVLQRLLEGGRVTASSFDVSPSPIASYLCLALGEAAMMDGLVDARAWWRGERPAREFLEAQPRRVTLALAAAAAQVAETRAGALKALTQLLGQAPSPSR
jgi:hypothetical protein